MLDINDPRWMDLTGASGEPLDPRPLLVLLERSSSSQDGWNDVMHTLCQDDSIGTSAYAIVPHLVQRALEAQFLPLPLLVLLTTIEWAKVQAHGPRMPRFLQASYVKAMKEAAAYAGRLIIATKDPEYSRGLLHLLAAWKGLHIYALAILEFSEYEIGEFVLSSEVLQDWLRIR